MARSTSMQKNTSRMEDTDPGSPESRRSSDREREIHEKDLHSRIAERAFILYEESGFRHGNDLEHWLEAERQVKTLGV